MTGLRHFLPSLECLNRHFTASNQDMVGLKSTLFYFFFGCDVANNDDPIKKCPSASSDNSSCIRW